MKESCNEGVASHIGPESCVDLPRGDSEALTGESIGRAIELRKHQIPEAELVVWREGNMVHSVTQAMNCSGGVKELGMCGHSSHGKRDTSERSLIGN